MKTLSFALVGIAAHCAFVSGCSHSTGATNSGTPASSGAQAMAVLLPLNQSAISGTLTLTEIDGGGVKVEGKLHGLQPGGRHGFHVHETGNCNAVDGSSAGPHFNPSNKPHGEPGSSESHVGDLGNILADASGDAEVYVVKTTATLSTGPNALMGRSIIVHKEVDDLKSQPAGASGERIGCAIIK